MSTGSLHVFAYRFQNGEQSAWAIPEVRQRPALARGPDGGLYLTWLEAEASSAILWVQTLDRLGERSGAPWSVGLGRNACGYGGLLRVSAYRRRHQRRQRDSKTFHRYLPATRRPQKCPTRLRLPRP